MIAVPLALLAAASNALASVLQRRAARAAPDESAFRLRLLLNLARRPVWLGGIAALTAGFVFQAVALSSGGLALVQPLLVAELPLTMLFLSWSSRIGVERRTWVSVAVTTAGLAAFLAAAAPTAGRGMPGGAEWIVAAVVTSGAVAGLVGAAHFLHDAFRAAVLGVSAGIGFAFTATFMTAVTRVAEHGLLSVFGSWQLYAMIAAGLGSLFLLQNALQSGTLVAAQPALTISDPVASILYGTTMFGESVRSGVWIILEAAGIVLIVYGTVRLAQSAVLREHMEAAA